MADTSTNNSTNTSTNTSPNNSKNYRFLLTPRWIAFHLLVLVAVAAMVWLGFWQLRRLDERKDFNAQVTSRSEQSAVSVDDLVAEPGFTPDGAAWRRVTSSGTWLPQQVIVFNRSQGGVAGDNVVTALAQDNGLTVLVNRGFVPLGTPPPPPPTGQVTVAGTARPSQERRRGQLSDNGLAITEVRRIDIDRLAAQFPGEVAPIYLDLESSTPPIGSGDPSPVPPPELSEGPHLAYAGQWFIFSICVAVGWVFAVRRSARTHRSGSSRRRTTSTDGSGEPAREDSSPRDVDATTTGPS